MGMAVKKTKLNLGCGFEIREGWLNTNHFSHEPVQGAVYLDATTDHNDAIGVFDFILINHVLCTLKPDDVDKILANVYKWLKPGGIVHIIDMDITLAIDSYKNGFSDFPIDNGSIDYNFLMHVSGFGTRLSLFTPQYMKELLYKHNFKDIHSILAIDDMYDTRKGESLRLEATK